MTTELPPPNPAKLAERRARSDSIRANCRKLSDAIGLMPYKKSDLDADALHVVTICLELIGSLVRSIQDRHRSTK